MPSLSRIHVGDRFGSLIVIERYPSIKISWLCQCDCGKQTNVRTDNLRKDSKCRYCFHKKGSECHQWKGHELIDGWFYGKIRKRSKEDNIFFDLRIEDIWDKYIEQNKVCSLSGVSVEFGKNASVDRITSKVGYTKCNIQIVDKVVNRLKWKLEDQDFITLCRDISLGQKEEGKYQKRTILNLISWKGVGDLGADYFNTLKYKSQHRKIKFHVTMEQLWEKFVEQNYRCALSGRLLVFASNTIVQTASLDRIDSDGDYEIDNLRWVHEYCNMCKNTMNDNDYIYWCNKVNEHRKVG